MDLLFRNRWVESPSPPPFEGCLRVRVLYACAPGGQRDSRDLSPAFVLWDLWTRRQRFSAGVRRYLRRYGLIRTLRAIRRALGSFHLRSPRPTAAFCGRISGSPGLCAGYRYGHPLFADYLVASGAQLAEVPSSLEPEDAATVFYYALALEATRKLSESGSCREPVLVLGDTLANRLLERLLTERGLTGHLRSTPEALTHSDRAALAAGSSVVVGSPEFLPRIERSTQSPLLLGLDPGSFATDELERLAGRWIGLPHPDVRNLDPLSRLPIEDGATFSSRGLKRALDHMAAREWRPSQGLTTLRPGSKPDLSRPCLLAPTGRDSEKSLVVRRPPSSRLDGSRLRAAAIGVGSWAVDTLLPVLDADRRVELVLGVDIDPFNLQMAARSFDFEAIASSAQTAFERDDLDAVFIATHHDSHAKYAVSALERGKKVFVEKPLALDHEELERVVLTLVDNPDAFLAVGYNRAQWVWTDHIRSAVESADGPASITAIVRELDIPATHHYFWPRNGPRVLSNGCHWIDLAHHVLGDRDPTTVQAIPATRSADSNFVVIVRYEDGSLVSLTFSERGDRYPHVHESIDVKAHGVHFMIQDFNRLLRCENGMVSKVWSGPAERGWERGIDRAVTGMIDGGPSRRYSELAASALIAVEARLSFESGGGERRIDTRRLARYRELLGDRGAPSDNAYGSARPRS